MYVKEQAAVDERSRQVLHCGTSGLGGSNTHRDIGRATEGIWQVRLPLQ
jgi:hypothetical protein